MQTVDVVKAVITAEHGWAVAEQFEDTFNGESFEEQNYNALMYIRTTVENILRSDVLSENAHDELFTYADDLEDYIVGEDDGLSDEENKNGKSFDDEEDDL
jgi:hypothetical protein